MLLSNLIEVEVEVCHDAYLFNLKAFLLSIVSSFLQLPIVYNKANVERPSIDFKLSNTGYPIFNLFFINCFGLIQKLDICIFS
jgi:hypothetical protein